jgi:FKBP-type peptidyl-prolyl cis-trans isomerase SlyD
MMKIASGLAVRMEYELKVVGGDVIESSKKSGPLRYVHGIGKMLPGLERRIEGMSPGEERRGEIPARDAFGSEDSLPLKEMARNEFPAGTKPTEGLVFEAKSERGDAIFFKVVSVTEQKVTVRLMHPLVGRDLAYWVKILSVDDPTAKPPLPPGVVELDLEEIQEDAK